MQKVLKIVHFSDVHLGKKFEIIKNDPGKRQLARNAIFKAFEEAFLKIESLKPDAVVIVGDLFDSNEPSEILSSGVSRVISNFAKTNQETTVILVPGGHDYLSGYSPYEKGALKNAANELKNLKITDSPGISVLEFKTSKNDLVKLHIYAHDKRSISLNWLSSAKPESNADFNVAAVHGSVADKLPSKDVFDPIYKKDMEKFDYVALGHWHSYREIKSGEKILGAYSGSLSRLDFKEDYNGGFVYAEICKDEDNTDVKLRLFKVSKIQHLKHRISSKDDADKLISKIEENNDCFYFLSLTLQKQIDPQTITRISKHPLVLEARVDAGEVFHQITDFPEDDYRHFLLRAIDMEARKMGLDEKDEAVFLAKKLALSSIEGKNIEELIDIEIMEG